MTDNLHIAHLLCTRLCHDLAGPIGAVSAGVELMGTDPSLVDAETLSLLSGSADAASRKVKFLRIAFGWPGGGMPRMDDLAVTFEDYLSATSGPSARLMLAWPTPEEFDSMTAKLGDTAAQLLANLALFGVECMPSCSALTIDVDANGSELEIKVQNRTVEGRTSKVRDDVAAAISGSDPNGITPHTVQAHLTRLLVTRLGGQLALHSDETGAITTARWS